MVAAPPVKFRGQPLSVPAPLADESLRRESTKKAEGIDSARIELQQRAFGRVRVWFAQQGGNQFPFLVFAIVFISASRMDLVLSPSFSYFFSLSPGQFAYAFCKLPAWSLLNFPFTSRSYCISRRPLTI